LFTWGLLVLAAVRRFLTLSFVVLLGCTSARADQWTKPTPDELQMTAEPEQPDAAAVILYREERADDKIHIHTTYMRVKILSEKGKEYADQEINYQSAKFKINAVEGRTIHSDGTVIPFTGKPYQKVVEKSATEKYKATVFTLPDVQVGSIIEYRYTIEYDSNLVVSPRWYLQGPLYTRKAHFYFQPTQHDLQDAHGGYLQARVAYASVLPPGVKVAYAPANNTYSVDVEKIPAYPTEDYMPPLHNYTYRMLFYYTIAKTTDEYWATEGKYWSKDADRFIDAGKLAGIESQIVSPADTPAQKLEKIYGAVMTLENTSFTREHTGAEDKALGIKTRTAADIWAQKRGNRDEITRLFVGLARAAGLKAYLGYVTNRDQNFFVPDFLEMSQLDDEIAIVELDGKEQFFDPGERYAAFGGLHWKHTATQGIRQTEKGVVVFMTPTPTYQSTQGIRTAFLTVQPDGKVTGNIRIILTGASAMRWRHLALTVDEDELKQQFTASIQREMPAGIQVETQHFLGVTDWRTNFMGILDVTGSMGTATAKRVFLPANFFAASSQPLFVVAKRQEPIDLQYPYEMQDIVTIKLPPGFDLESLPKDAEFSYPQNTFYRAKYTREANTLKSERVMAIGTVIYKAEEYPQLKDFYQKANAKDKEPAVLQLSQASGTTTTGAGK
jgi:hypothetical protein